MKRFDFNPPPLLFNVAFLMGENGFWVLARRPCEQDLTSKEKRTDLFVYRKRIYIALLVISSLDQDKIQMFLREANAEGCKAIFISERRFPFKSILKQDAASPPNTNLLQKRRKKGGRKKGVAKKQKQLKLKLKDYE